ncbi:GAF domain-containing protein [Phormidium sp. CLA17]|uniref:sensor histidine kinase n=1 Tax=Leptolyngbya sp. Cla-17 TaxID=2803751 RepID=UPI001492F1DA|nr:GAF domain-containing protein [Leptolyngbya sp. Cla-17]MBM0741265.1 GAF domain-containing protein [Leptolyngbya sp. Cla-17]
MVQPKEPQSYDKQLVALGRILQTLREEENSDVLIDTVLNYLKTEFDYSLVWVGLYDRLEHRLFGKGGIIPAGDQSFLKQRFSLQPGDILEQVVIQQRALAVPDLREEVRSGDWRKAAKKSGIQGTVIFPIRYRDLCYGVALLGSTEWGMSPRADEKARLSMLLGELAAALFKIETEWQRQQAKRPDVPLLQLLTQMRSLSGLGPRLEAVVEETHAFIQPARTNIYWYERERRYFWRRLGNRQRTVGFKEANQLTSGITVQEINGFYQALMGDQIVAIGEAHSSLKADATSRLMQQIKARSLLAAPILYQNELLGFLAVEGTEPRIWTDGDKSFVRGAAQMIALTAPLDEMESAIAQIQLDRELTAGIARSIYSEEDWKNTLKHAADTLCKRLKVERFLVLLYEKDLKEFEVSYQNHPSNRRPLAPLLEALSDTDLKMVQKSTEAISIENLDTDIKLVTWRDRLLEAGVRSLVLCNTSIGQPLEGLIVIGHESPRGWNRVERELVQVVSQQIGFILHQWQLQRQTEQLQTLSQSMQWGLTAMQEVHDPKLLEQSALQQVAKVMQVPLALLIGWIPGQTDAKLISLPPPSDRFAANLDTTIPIHTDFLVQWALEQDGVLSLSVADLPVNSRQWLYGTGIGQILAIALRTSPEHQPTGILIVVDEAERRWAERHLSTFSIFANQLAWTRRYLSLTKQLTTQRLELERLNWYKHRRLEDVQRSVQLGLRRLDELGTPKEPLFATRQQQILRQLKDAIAPVNETIAAEQWHFQTQNASITLITLLKRTLERVDGLIKERQLWSQVHDETNINIGGDVLKIELIVYEVLLDACQRSSTGGRIDLWCRQIDARWFELSITDSGPVESHLFTELETGRTDWLAPSILDHPPGLHLLICQALMKQVGGEFNFYKLEDGRNTSRLILPIAGTANPKSKSRGKP